MKITVSQLHERWMERGRQSRRAGHTIHQNPYQQSLARQHWEHGWNSEDEYRIALNEAGML